MRGNSSIAVQFDDVAVDPSSRIGEEGSGAELVFGVVAPTFLVGLAAVNVGIAQAALSAVTEHVKARRYADGTQLSEVQSIQHALADMDIDIRASRLLLADAAALADAGDEGALVPLMESKIRCTDVSGGSRRRRSRYAVARATRCRCRSSVIFATPAPVP